MTQNGEGQEAPGATPQVLTFGAPTVGDVLAERYQLEEHIGNDTLGRQLWRGVDVILRRPVAVVLRYPGGDSASEMLSAAVAASRIVHPHLVGVYDAIDEDDRAYVVREWVDGTSLRELVADEPLDPDRAATLTCAIADAVAAIHATGMAHGNIHPGTVLIAGDGRVVLTDARADEATTAEADLRAIGAVLYCSLTGYWPHAEAGATRVPDAIRDSGGNLAAPRQVRGGVPSYLDELTMDLLRSDATLPAADVLVGELSRFEQEGGHPLFAGEESGGFRAFDSAAAAPEPPRPASRKLLVGVVALLVIAVAGVLGAVKVLSGPEAGDIDGAGVTGTSAPQQGNTSKPVNLDLAADQIRIIDWESGNGSEVRDAKLTVDRNLATGWKTENYYEQFGGFKKGMGVLIDLREPRPCTSVRVDLLSPGSTVELRIGNDDPGPKINDDKLKGFTLVDEPKTTQGSNVILACDRPEPVRYLLIWITKLAADGKGGFRAGIQEINLLPRQSQ